MEKTNATANETTANTTTNSKGRTTAFNLVILDESGSMSDLTKQTIDGCNETLNVVRSLQKEHGDSTRQLVSIYAFQSGSVPSRYICKNVPADTVKNITSSDYEPMGCTPMLDAIGMTLVDLKAVASTHEDATASVTIITDGYENSSKEFTWKQVADLISELKERGWNFNFIGANVDVDQVASRMNVDNRMAFKSDQEGTREMWACYADSLNAYESERIKEECAMPNMTYEQRRQYRMSKSKSFFKK